MGLVAVLPGNPRPTRGATRGSSGDEGRAAEQLGLLVAELRVQHVHAGRVDVEGQVAVVTAGPATSPACIGLLYLLIA
jgi:hypothetical protein